MKISYEVRATFPSGWGAEHIGRDGNINKFGISFSFNSKSDAEKALKVAKIYFRDKGLKRKIKIVEHKTLS